MLALEHLPADPDPDRLREYLMDHYLVLYALNFLGTWDDTTIPATMSAKARP